MYKNIINRLKDKHGMNQSVEYILYFFITVLLIFLFIDVILAFCSVYQAHVTATNVSRVISVSGGYDTVSGNNVVDSTYIYEMAQEQLKPRLSDVASLEIEVTDDSGTVKSLTSDNHNDSYVIDLGKEFKVTVSGDVPFMRVFGKSIDIKISSSSSGVSEVYHKS